MNNNWSVVKLIGGIYVLYEVYELVKGVVEKDPEAFDPPVAIALAVVFAIVGGGFLISSLLDFKKLKQSEKAAAKEAKVALEADEEEDAIEAECIEVVEAEESEDILEDEE